MSRNVDEDLIEAAIRRAAASKAAQTDESTEPDVQEGDGTGAPTHAPALRLVPLATDDRDDDAGAIAARPPADERLIEATLRRIEVEQAARVAAATATSAASDAVNITAVAPWEDAVRALRQELDETKRDLRALEKRLDAMALAQPPRTTPSAPHVPAATVPNATRATQTAQAADDWDDAPQLPRMPLGGPPRPAIVRDPSPRTATAAVLESPDADAAPAVDGKRGFDLLPRTYRITVEDKRRAVDLVPLHRALLGMDGVRDMSLLSYSNGTAMVALETTAAIDPHALGTAVSRAMAREATVEVHNEQTMVIKLAED
jgi:hypothetical protein